ncbi:MAG: beta-lactamase family protein [Bacteroidetes bacterium]|nr:beta-lactamase family protein [Bacteroidota bacterium]MBS1632070.1 beta-lactamase family protein [Bacteroidota bacterium]
MSYKIKAICLKSSLVLSFLLLFQPLFSQYNFSQLGQTLTDYQKDLGSNVVFQLWDKDSMLYKKEMGDFNSKTQTPIASCSKWLTAALVMIFADEGKISLDDPIVKYLPVFGNYFKNYITIRQCLSHFTGIKSDQNIFKRLLKRKKFSSLEEEVNSFASQDIESNPGTEFRYSEIGLNIAGRILEIVSKRRFDLLIKQKLFNPLGMRRTTFSTLDGSAVNPSGGAQSTPDDYMKFLVMLLNNGKYKGQQILSESAVDQMRQIQTTPQQIKYAPKSADGFNYALGSWVLEGDGGKKANVLSSPGLFGTWPVVDFCRGYAYIVFVKNLQTEGRTDLNLEIKKEIDIQIPSHCK